ncbi:MAG TPA: isoprenylcysteine carboxylmethyltransferase family protein [Terriglobales bacterium]|nr:isoprenylcysteine carboxylmethyltransferase family protein [Terriglobales bacterium]
MKGWQQYDIETWLWVIFALYWLVGALTAAKVKAREGWASSLPRNALLALGGVLLYGKWFSRALLGRRFVPALPSIWAAGVLLTIAGLALAFWARYHLGGNWSGQITLKENHTLVCTGPYKYLRHPIYSGLLLAVVGTGLTVGLYRALLGVLLIVLGLWWKARQEDAWLARAFGEQFEQQRRRTGRLLPRWRRAGAEYLRQ